MLGECAKLVVVGVLVSMLGFAYIDALVRSQLYGVEASDSTALIVSVVRFVLVGLLAAVAPSQRAVRIEPMDTLRKE